MSDKALKTLDNPQREDWIGLFCGSLFGNIRNWIGVTGSAYIYADDEALFAEMIDTVAELSYLGSEEMIRQTINFDFGHFWEDICFNNGPLISPKVFRQYVGHHYKRITALLNKHGIDLVSSYCA